MSRLHLRVASTPFCSLESGPLCDAMKYTKDTKQYVTTCRAHDERKRIQHRDAMFKNKQDGWFKVLKRIEYDKLLIDGVSIT